MSQKSKSSYSLFPAYIIALIIVFIMVRRGNHTKENIEPDTKEDYKDILGYYDATSTLVPSGTPIPAPTSPYNQSVIMDGYTYDEDTGCYELFRKDIAFNLSDMIEKEGFVIEDGILAKYTRGKTGDFIYDYVFVPTDWQYNGVERRWEEPIGIYDSPKATALVKAHK